MRVLLAAGAGLLVLLGTWPALCVQGEYDEGSCTSALLLPLPWTAEDADLWGPLTSLPLAVAVFLVVLRVRRGR